MSAKAKVEQARTLLKEAMDILQGQPSAEDRQRAKALMDEANALKEDAAQLQVLEQASVEMGEAEASQTAQTTKFNGFGDFAAALVRKFRGEGTDPRLRAFRDKDEDIADNTSGRSEKAMSGNTGAAGGILIPQEAYAQLMAVAAPLTVVRQRATIIRMRRRSISIPVLDQTGATAGVPAFFGGIRAYWKDSGTQGTETAPTFRKSTLTAHKLMCYTLIENELMDDADLSLADFLAGPLGFPGAIAWNEDYAFFQGSGAGQPMGVVNAPATIAVTRTTSSHIKYADVVNIIASFMGRNPVWTAHQSVLADLLIMEGPSGNPAYLWGDASKGVPNTLMGYPIEFTDKNPALGSKGDLMLNDWGYYVIGDRQATTVNNSPHEKFSYDETVWVATHRVDGQPWLPSAITLADGSTTVSPFVTVAA